MLLRLGVTGHRSLADPSAVARRVDAAIDEAVDAAGATELEVWSSLAEGADRLVAERVLVRPATRLVAVLPLPLDDYRRDCVDAASAAHLADLVDRASRVEVTGPDPSGERTSAYERAGHAVVDGCDVLLALWDGDASRGRGGTAEIVTAAHDRGRQVVVIAVERAAAP